MVARSYSFLPAPRNTASGTRGIVLGFIFIILAGVFQILPNGLVFLGQIFHAPIPRDDAVLQMLQARIADLEAERNTYSAQPVSVLVSPGFVFSDSLLISGGTAYGTQKEDVVISSGGIAVGVVTEIGEKWSKAALLSRLGNVVVLRAGNAKEIVFEARGIGGGELRAELPSAIMLRAGDTVWLGSDPTYIAGLVDTVDHAPGRQLQQLIIRVPLSPEQLYRVFTVRSPGS